MKGRVISGQEGGLGNQGVELVGFFEAAGYHMAEVIALYA